MCSSFYITNNKYPRIKMKQLIIATCDLLRRQASRKLGEIQLQYYPMQWEKWDNVIPWVSVCKQIEILKNQEPTPNEEQTNERPPLKR